MKSKLLKCVYSYVFPFFMIIFIFVFFHYANHILCRKVSETRYYDLMKGKANPQILFVGNSHVTSAVIPAQLWEEHKLTSYILCSEYNDIRRDIAMCKLACQYCKPDLIVLDVENYWSRSKEEDVLLAYHEFADGFPLNKVKYDTTIDLFGYSEEGKEILFPVLRYHERWKDLSSGDFKVNKKESFIYKNYQFSDHVEQIEQYDYVGEESGVLLTEGTDIQYIREIISWCKDQGIQIMMVSIPYSAMEDEQAALWGLNEISEEYKIPYVNMVSMKNFTDPETDYKDEWHMNYEGAKKVTSYIGNFIKSNYSDLSDVDRETENNWNDSVALFKKEIKSKMEKEE